MIRLRDVSVKFRSQAILEGVSLSIRRGELAGILGPNGAGKTTLLSLVNGLIRPSTGEVEVMGKPLRNALPGEFTALRLKIGYVPQLLERRGGLLLSAREVVAIGRTGVAGLMRRLSNEDHAKVRQWLDRLGLNRLADRPYARLSGGEQRKVHLARALAQEPEILLLDEPGSGLDILWQQELSSIISSLWKEMGITVLFVSHDLTQLPRECTRLVLMANGRVLRSDTPGKVLDPALLSGAYGRRVKVGEVDGRPYVSLDGLDG